MQNIKSKTEVLDKKILLGTIKKDLFEYQDLEYQKGSVNFFKEKIKPIGVRASDTRKVAAKYYSVVKDLPKKKFYKLCEELLEDVWMEPKTIVFDWLRRSRKIYDKSDFYIFERWLKKYVTNWAHCDDFCTHAFGALLFKHPQHMGDVKAWTSSKNRWMRRASAVIMIYPLRFGDKQWLEECFSVADKLLEDEDDLVQKGYGWMLKVASEKWRQEVFDYVMKTRQKMPRTALRYAIEKMPKGMKKAAMSK